ncbi:MAG: bifunctional methionine sulfoxide reductase B/A protein [Zetaproteobacteria bacterium]|nr:bifunctional methionine sulfoxide reductase B/A protein [Zetaproteobacteria bacterium]
MPRYWQCIAIFSLFLSSIPSDAQERSVNTFNPLTPEEKRIILHKGTERPFSGAFDQFFEQGTYQCKRCNTPLYQSDSKFASSCGWPSFDDEIPGAVLRKPDSDGERTEIVCARCGAHLGHIFKGERLTPKNTRHCVNSLSLTFIADSQPNTLNASPPQQANAYFAGGCFWGIEYLFEHKAGVIAATSGYMGGSVKNPTYHDVSDGKTGHLETVEVTYDPSRISYTELAKFFFEIHDPTQANGQGPDIGSQYLSAVFYNNEQEKRIAASLIEQLKKRNYAVVTHLIQAHKFWPAEAYHQNYYDQNHKQPYCHAYTKRFD